MVEVGILGNDKVLAREAQEKLENLVKAWEFEEMGRQVYRGHPAMYCDAAAITMRTIQESGGFPREELLRRKPHWNKDFQVRIAEDVQQHNYMFASEIISDLARHTSEGRPVIWITPVGPMGHYPVIAEMMNKNGERLGINPDLIFTFAMDEWSDENGDLITDTHHFRKYMGGFAEDMQEQFYSLLNGKIAIPKGNLRFAANKGLRDYFAAMDDLLGDEAGVIFTGGVGMIGHIMFWEPTYGKLLGKETSEKVTYIKGAPLTTETLAQNRFTSAASAPVPAFANTIGLGLFCMLREYGEQNPGRVRAVFGLDNVEEPLIWQRFIAQSMLTMNQTDPSFGATYPATMPGAYIVVKNHLKGFKVASK